jgi:methionine synthase II (cobalamin-independent)
MRHLSDIVGRLFPTTIGGSYPRPRWNKVDLGERDFRAAMRDAQFAETYRDSARSMIGDQIEVGVDLPTDGYPWYDRHEGANTSYLNYPALQLAGIELESEVNPLVLAYGEAILASFVGTTNKATVTGPIGRGTLRLADLVRVSKALTPTRLKFGFGMGPANLARWLTDLHYSSQKALYRDLADAYNAELKDAVAAGAEIVHLDDVGFALHAPEDYPLVLDTLNRAFDGVDAFRILHCCHLASGAPIGTTPYEAFHPIVARELQVEACEYAFAETGFRDADFRLWQDHPSDKGLGIDVVDIKRLAVDSPEQIVAGVRTALRYIEPERIHLTTDCGLFTFPRPLAKGKVAAMVAAAEMLRSDTGADDNAAHRTP